MRTPTAPVAPAWWRLWPLGALAVAVVVLALTGVLPTWPGLVHLVALPPLDVFADARVLMQQAPSWPAFWAIAMAVAAVRITLLAWLTGGLDRSRLVFATVFYAVVLLPTWLLAFFATTGAAAHYARFFWPAIGLFALLVVVWLPTPWQGQSRLRAARRAAWRSGLRLEVSLPYLAVVLALGALADLLPGTTLPAVVASAAATAGVVRAMARPPVARPGLLLASATVAFAVAASVFVATRDGGPLPEPSAPRQGSLLVLGGVNSYSGHGSVFNADPGLLGYRCEQVYYFSYAGPGDGQPQGQALCPSRTGAPYEPADTHRPFAEQVEQFALQTADLPRPLTVLAQSYSAWLSWEALATGVAEADTLILAGPFPHSVLGYLPPGTAGQGQVYSDLLRAAAPLTDLVGFHFDPAAPAARELLATRTAAQRIFGQPLPEGMRSMSITSAGDLALMPDGWRMAVTYNACPARVPHPYIPFTAVFYREAQQFLAGGEPLACPVWRDWGAPLARPFGPPPGAGGAWDELAR